MEDFELGERLFCEGEKKLSNFYERAPYCGSGMHSTDYHAIIMRDYFIPAAEKGFPPAMKECGDYFARSNKELALNTTNSISKHAHQILKQRQFWYFNH